MTSRERIIAALNHKQPDRVPVDFGCTPVSGIAVSTVSRLRKAFGLDTGGERVKVLEPYQMLGELDEELRKRMLSDCAGIYGKTNRFGFPNSDWKEWTTFDGEDVLVPGLFNTVPDEKGDILMYPEGDTSVPPSARMPEGGFYFDTIIRQYPIDEDKLDPSDNLEDFSLIGEEQLEDFKTQSEWLRANTDYGIFVSMPGTSLGNISSVPGPWLKDPKGIRDIEEWYVSLLIRSDYVREIFKGQTEIAMKNLVMMKEALGDRVDIIYLTGTDFGTQRGPITSREIYRDLFMPFFKEMCGWIHENTPWKTMIHTCGGIRPLVDDIIDSGFDILNPVQTSAEGMDPRELKDAFGDRVVFHGGGIDTQHTLPYGTPEEVYDEVRDRIRILNKDGGYIFNTIHNIQADVPVENVFALLKAVEDSR
ncbi:uroporphyrinogen decarboxylase family protein [Candidatus Latescibacterota bacterium]